MRLAVSTRWLPKAGSSSAEYEDAFAPRRWRPTREPTRKRFAVADGASESLLAARWANLLVRRYCSPHDTGDPATVFADCVARWPEELAQYTQGREQAGRPIQWFEEPGLERGAFATFLGLELHHSAQERAWTAVALGDSCLFQFRGDELITAFPRQPGDDFDINPPLLCSRADDLDVVLAHTETFQGRFAVGDTFVLVTDAVAAWFLGAPSQGHASWAYKWPFLESPTRRAFNGWVRELRKSGAMRNDDVTVMQVQIEG